MTVKSVGIVQAFYQVVHEPVRYIIALQYLQRQTRRITQQFSFKYRSNKQAKKIVSVLVQQSKPKLR